MGEKLTVDPSDLRASAHAQDTIADAIKEPDQKAISDTKDAAASLKGWDLAAGLLEIADSWKPALDGLHARLKMGASNLRHTASSHDWNDQLVRQDFEDFDGDFDGVIVSAPASRQLDGPATHAATGSGPSGTTFQAPPPPGFEHFRDGQPGMPLYDPAGHSVGPQPGASSPSVDDMLNTGPAPMPTYEPEGIQGGPAPANVPSPAVSEDFG